MTVDQAIQNHSEDETVSEQDQNHQGATTAKQRVGRPQFVGVTTFDDPQGRYEFRHPVDWRRSALDDDLDGIICVAEDDEPATYFGVQVTELPLQVTADDREVLVEGFEAGMAGLTEVTELESADAVYGNIVKVDRTITFREGDQMRKRHVWALHADRWQYTIVFQGATEAEYHYWLPMGNYCFSSFQLPHELWFATDPELHPKPAS